MTLIAKRLFTTLLALLVAAPLAFAQGQRSYSQAELEQMLAPVALYPDPLLSQVLMASTYPLEVMEAARWSRANPGLQGDDAVRAAQREDWDPSVISLVAFPQVLQRMDENLDWMQSLGEAFLAQEPQVMETVQGLRRRAQAAGNLQSGEQIHVQQQGQAILVQPANPRTVYVPYYDPWVAYGAWLSPAYPPLAWAPWPGYARPYRPGVNFSFWWGTPVGLSVNFFFGNFDWHRRGVRVVHANTYYYRPPVVVNRTVVTTPHRWQHEPRRRPVVAPAAAVTRAAVAAPAVIAAPVQAAAPERVRPQSRVQAEVRAPARVERRVQTHVVPRVETRVAPRAVPRFETRAAEVRPQSRRAEVPSAQPRTEQRTPMPAAVARPQAPQRREASSDRDRAKHGKGRS